MPKLSTTDIPAAAQHRILLVLTEFPPGFGGMQTHACYLADHLQKLGHSIAVLTYRPADKEQAALCKEFDDNCGYPVHRVLSRIGYWNNIEITQHWAQQFQADLIYASNVYYGLLELKKPTPLTARSVGNDVLRPWIVYPFRLGSRLLSSHWFERHLYQQFRHWNTPEWIERLLRRQRHKLMQRSAQGLNHILANSHYTAEALQEIGVPSNRVQVLVGGVDSQRFTPQHADTVALRAELGLPTSGQILLTACRLVAKKGIDFLLRQMPELIQQYGDIHLVVIGEGREHKRCKALVAQLQLSNRVHFIGSISHHDIHRYYWCADLFVLASRVVHSRWSGMKDAETMGRVLCEANATGVPVLTSNSGGIPSVVQDEQNRLLFAEDDAADFQRQLHRILNDPTLRQRLSAQGLMVANSQFDWTQIVAAHEEAFQLLLS